jgi:hypothetical protein
MCEATSSTIEFPALRSQNVLTDILRAEAQQMLATAIDAEIAEWIDSHAHLTDDAGHRPSRTLLGNEQTAGCLSSMLARASTSHQAQRGCLESNTVSQNMMNN